MTRVPTRGTNQNGEKTFTGQPPYVNDVDPTST